MNNTSNSPYIDDFVEKFMTEGEPAVESEKTQAETYNHISGSTRDDMSQRILENQLVQALREIYDPEIPVNIYDLGLIYKMTISDERKVDIEMTLTAPGCPVAHTFPGMVECAVKEVEGVSDACVELVWDPPWTQDRMTDVVKLELGLL